MNCQHCNEPNPEGYFYCRNCEQRASAPKFTVNTIMRDTPMAKAIRTDQINLAIGVSLIIVLTVNLEAEALCSQFLQ